MHTRHWTLTGMAALAMTASGAAGARAASGYTYTSIVVPGCVDAQPAALNTGGLVAGTCLSGDDPVIFTYDHGAYATFAPPNAGSINVGGVADNGAVAGWYTTRANGPSKAFTYANGVFHAFGARDSLTEITAISPTGIAYGYHTTGGASETIFTLHNGLVRLQQEAWYEGSVYAANGNGTGVGSFGADGSLWDQGLIARNGLIEALPPLPNKGTYLRGVNDAGLIVGYTFDGRYTEGLTLYRDKPSIVDCPGATNTYFVGVDAAGDIAGECDDAHGFVLSGGVFTPVVFPGSFVTGIVAMNASGQVIGLYRSDAITTGYIATPQ